MDSLEQPYQNYELDMLEKSILKKKQRIPKGKKKRIKYRMYINGVLKKYPKAVLCCSRYHGFRCIDVDGYINPKEFTRLNREFSYISLFFYFNAVGTSEKFVDKLRPSNWFLTPKTKY